MKHTYKKVCERRSHKGDGYIKQLPLCDRPLLKGSVWTAFTQKGMFLFFYQQYWDEIFRSNFSKLEGTRETVPFVWTPFTQSSMFLHRRSPTFFRLIFSKRQVFLEFFYMSYRPWTFSCIIFCMYISLVPNNRSK